MKRALLSIGTNSTRLLALDGERRIAGESRGTRLGTGIGAAGAIDPDARARTLEALAEYVQGCRRLGVEAIDAISTSVLRRAVDGPAFSAEVAALAGVEPRILSGDDEAAYAFLGATRAATQGGLVGVLDVGGGSAELAVDDPLRARANASVARTLSVEIGAVRLSERYPALLGARALPSTERLDVTAQARADAAAVLAPFAALIGFPTLLAVGGTVFTAAMMLARGAADGVQLTRGARGSLIDALLARDLAGRKTMAHIRPQRADILPAGLIVVDEACRILGLDTVTAVEADLLLGYLTSPAYRAVPFGGQ